MGGLSHKIEIVKENWTDILRDAYLDITEYGYNIGHKRIFILIQLISGIQKYDLSFANVMNVVQMSGTGLNYFMYSIEGMSFFQNISQPGFIPFVSQGDTGIALQGLGDFMMHYKNLKMIKEWFEIDHKFHFNENTGILKVHDSIRKNEKAFVDCFIAENIENLYNNRFFINLTVCHAQLQWVENVMGKYNPKFAAGELNLEGKKEKYEEKRNNIIEELRKHSRRGLFKRD